MPTTVALAPATPTLPDIASSIENLEKYVVRHKASQKIMNIDAAKPYLEIVAGMANALTIIASTIAIYLYIKNRAKISSAVQLLLNFSFQTTLGEIKEKLERLNEYNANEPDDLMEIKSILHEIAGQINGNPKLSLAMPEMASKIETLTQNKKLTEPMRRSIVSEIREKLRNIEVNSMSNNPEN